MMRRSAKERQDAIDVVQKTLHAGLIVWAKVCGDAVTSCQAKTSGVCPTKWVNCVTCVGQSPACVWGQSCVLSTGHQAGVFPRSAGACSRRQGPRIHRQRDTAGGGGVATRLQRQSVIVEHCTTVGELIVIEARRSVQCVVRGFLETFAHKSHRYISRYPEIFEKKSRLIVRKIR